MKRQLLILRHGKSDWDVPVSDFNRPLKDRGKRGAQRMASWMHGHDRVPDYVITSPATRALQTALKACKAMGLSASDVHQDARIYEASRRDLINVLADCPPDTRRVMLVGHNPGLEDLLFYLSDGAIPIPDDGKLLPTAALAVLETGANWDALRPAGMSLQRIVRARDLPKDFPYPLDEPTERRPRPAYYYRQSSVIPYRRDEQGLQLLLVASSKGTHWVVPKGIHEPGLSAQDSAAKEAWEEAGVEGIVDQAELGRYHYEKWEAQCDVTVYPMEVTRELSESDWEESHRGRQWVSTEEARRLIRQPALVAIIDALVQRLDAGA